MDVTPLPYDGPGGGLLKRPTEPAGSYPAAASLICRPARPEEWDPAELRWAIECGWLRPPRTPEAA